MSKVIFGDVVRRCNTKEDRHNTDKIYYVGGEHIESNEVLVENRGLIEGSTIGPMFYFGFKEGDILFVSRNPHLRKAGMVTFDGICSEKTFVLETKDESVLLQRYLAFVMQSDHFWSYMETHKSGSVNFFINWSTLEKYEFELPSIEVQKSLSDVLWAANTVKRAYRNLCVKTDELLKSQFSELASMSDTYPLVKLKELLVQNKATEKIIEPHKEKLISVALYGKGISERDIGNDTLKPFSGVRIKEGQFVYSRIWARKGALGLVPKHLDGAVVTNEFPTFDINTKKVNPIYLLYAVQDENFLGQIDMSSMGSTSKQRIKESTFLEYTICLPPVEQQNLFAQNVTNGKMSKEELVQAISNLIDLEKSILAENHI